MNAAADNIGIWQTPRKDGPQKGGRLVQIRNATGLCVELLPDRCLDIGQVWLHGVPFAWMGPWGLPSKGAGVSMDTALGGLMATCGFDHIHQPVRHAGHAYPLHGNMALTPCQILRLHPARPPVGDFVVEAVSHARAPDGAEYTLTRRISLPYSGNEISLQDQITTTPDSPIFALYHINLGDALIGADTRVSLNADDLTDRLSPVPAVQIGPAGAGTNTARVQNGATALTVRFKGQDLPWLQTYRRAEADMNLFCIEPVSHDRKPRAELLREGGETAPSCRDFSLRFSFDTGADRPDL